MSKTVLKHTILFSAFVLLAQVFGLLRDLYLTRVFGVGEILDTYYLAFKIPDFLNVFYSVFLGSVIFIPLLTKAKYSLRAFRGVETEVTTPGKFGGSDRGSENDNREEVQNKINVVGGLVLTLLLIFSSILFIFMPFFTNLLAPNFPVTQKDLLINLSRLLLIGQFFFPVGILAGCIGMVYGKPFGAAVSGFIYSFTILIGAIFLVPIFGIYGLVYSVILGSIFFMLVQIYPGVVREYFAKFRFKFYFPEWKSFILKNVPRFFAVLAYQAYSLIILVIAGLAGTGGVTSFSIAYNIYLAAFYVMGASFSNVLMPRISESHVRGDKEIQKNNLRKSLLITFLFTLLAAICIYYLSDLIIKILYFFSKLSTSEEIFIAHLLSLLALGFPFFNLLEVIRKYLYSTDQIFFAGSITTSILFLLSVFTFLLSRILFVNILISLILSINLSLVLVSISTLSILKFKKQI